MKEVDGREVFDMINDLVGHGDDCRGFYLDMEYLDGIRQNTSFTHLGITFKFKVHKDTNGIKDANNNFFIDYYENDPAKYYDGQHRWRGGNSEYWGKADDMSEEWKTVNIPLNESNTSELFFLSESQGFYIEKIVPFERAAYAAEVKDTDAFGMEVAVQCGGNDTLPDVKLFYNAVSDSADAALAATTVSVGNGIEVNGNITPAFTLADGKDANEWGAVDPQNSKRFTLPRLTDPTLGVHNHESGKAYIRWQIVNGESDATLEIYYFFAKGNDGHADHSGTYEKVLSIGNLPKLNDGFAGFIVNGSKEKDPNLTEFMSFNGLAMAEEISSDGAVVDFNTQCARDDQYWSIRLFYNAKDKDLASAKAAPSVFFANGTGANKDLVKAENMTGTAAFEDPNEWGKTNAAENCYDFLQFRDAHLKAMHDGNSGRVYVRMAIFNEGNTATLKVYFDNRSNNDMGRGKQILALTVTGLDPVEDGFIGLMIDDSVFGSHWFEKNSYFTEGFAVSPYSLAYSENVAADTNKIAMTFGAQCGESIRDVRLFYNSAAKTVAGANASAGALFKGDVVSISATGDVSFADGKEWGSAFDGAAEKYNLLHMQKAHEKGYHDPDSGVVTVKIEIENDAEGDTATLKMLFKNPATGTFDLILTVSGMDKLASGYAGLIVDDDAISHKHIKDFALN